MEVQFYLAKNGQVLYVVGDGENNEACCDLELLVADTKDAALEKHVPEVTREGNKLDVVVGSVEHPMTEEHYIQFIAVAQGGKVQVQRLQPNEAPKASFVVEDGPVVVYEYCNLHGLWKKEA